MGEYIGSWKRILKVPDVDRVLFAVGLARNFYITPTIEISSSRFLHMISHRNYEPTYLASTFSLFDKANLLSSTDLSINNLFDPLGFDADHDYVTFAFSQPREISSGFWGPPSIFFCLGSPLGIGPTNSIFMLRLNEEGTGLEFRGQIATLPPGKVFGPGGSICAAGGLGNVLYSVFGIHPICVAIPANSREMFWVIMADAEFPYNATGLFPEWPDIYPVSSGRTQIRCGPSENIMVFLPPNYVLSLDVRSGVWTEMAASPVSYGNSLSVAPVGDGDFLVNIGDGSGNCYLYDFFNNEWSTNPIVSLPNPSLFGDYIYYDPVLSFVWAVQKNEIWWRPLGTDSRLYQLPAAWREENSQIIYSTITEKGSSAAYITTQKIGGNTPRKIHKLVEQSDGLIKFEEIPLGPFDDFSSNLMYCSSGLLPGTDDLYIWTVAPPDAGTLFKFETSTNSWADPFVPFDDLYPTAFFFSKIGIRPSSSPEIIFIGRTMADTFEQPGVWQWDPVSSTFTSVNTLLSGWPDTPDISTVWANHFKWGRLSIENNGSNAYFFPSLDADEIYENQDPLMAAQKSVVRFNIETGIVQLFNGIDLALPPFRINTPFIFSTFIHFPQIVGIWRPDLSALEILALPPGNFVTPMRWQYFPETNTWRRVRYRESIDNRRMSFFSLLGGNISETTQIGFWKNPSRFLFVYDYTGIWHTQQRLEERFLVELHLEKTLITSDLSNTVNMGPPFEIDIENIVYIFNLDLHDITNDVLLRSLLDLNNFTTIQELVLFDIFNEVIIVEMVNIDNNVDIKPMLTFPVLNPVARATGAPTEIFLSWKSNPNNIGHDVYSIQRSPAGLNNWIEIAILPYTSETFIDSTADTTTSRDYRIVAYLSIDGIDTTYNQFAIFNNEDNPGEGLVPIADYSRVVLRNPSSGALSVSSLGSPNSFQSSSTVGSSQIIIGGAFGGAEGSRTCNDNPNIIQGQIIFLERVVHAPGPEGSQAFLTIPPGYSVPSLSELVNIEINGIFQFSGTVTSIDRQEDGSTRLVARDACALLEGNPFWHRFSLHEKTRQRKGRLEIKLSDMLEQFISDTDVQISNMPSQVEENSDFFVPAEDFIGSQSEFLSKIADITKHQWRIDHSNENLAVSFYQIGEGENLGRIWTTVSASSNDGCVTKHNLILPALASRSDTVVNRVILVGQKERRVEWGVGTIFNIPVSLQSLGWKWQYNQSGQGFNIGDTVKEENDWSRYKFLNKTSLIRSSSQNNKLIFFPELGKYIYEDMGAADFEYRLVKDFPGAFVDFPFPTRQLVGSWFAIGYPPTRKIKEQILTPLAAIPIPPEDTDVGYIITEASPPSLVIVFGTKIERGCEVRTNQSFGIVGNVAAIKNMTVNESFMLIKDEWNIHYEEGGVEITSSAADECEDPEIGRKEGKGRLILSVRPFQHVDNVFISPFYRTLDNNGVPDNLSDTQLLDIFRYHNLFFYKVCYQTEKDTIFDTGKVGTFPEERAKVISVDAFKSTANDLCLNGFVHPLFPDIRVEAEPEQEVDPEEFLLKMANEILQLEPLVTGKMDIVLDHKLKSDTLGGLVEVVSNGQELVPDGRFPIGRIEHDFTNYRTTLTLSERNKSGLLGRRTLEDFRKSMEMKLREERARTIWSVETRFHNQILHEYKPLPSNRFLPQPFGRLGLHLKGGS